jgi:hypothetical protein
MGIFDAADDGRGRSVAHPTAVEDPEVAGDMCCVGDRVADPSCDPARAPLVVTASVDDEMIGSAVSNNPKSLLDPTESWRWDLEPGG